MKHSLKKYVRILPFLIIFCTLNALMLLNLLEANHEPFLGIASRRGLLGLQILVSFAVVLICTGYGVLVKRRPSKLYTVVLAAVSPAVHICLMEGMTGNLGTLTRDGLLLNIAIAAVFLVLLFLFFRNVTTAVMVQTVVLAVLALVQYYVYLFRGRSFTLSDIRVLGTAADVAGGYSYGMHFGTGVSALLAAGWMMLLALSPRIHIRRFIILRRAAALAACAGIFFCLSDEAFVAKHNSLKMEMWNIDKAYREKGVLLTLASQVQYLTVDKPEGYFVQAVQQTAEAYASAYDSRMKTERRDSGGNQGTVSGNKDTALDKIIPENVIVIMNESFADLRVFGAYEDKLSVMPFIDSMEENVRKGWLNVPVLGGGTSNSEYEVLTGNCMAFWDNWTMAYQVYGQEKEYGMASTLKSQGYRSVAMHPHRALNYNRSAVYPSMGFDEFLSRENWKKKYKKKIRKFVSDQSCYEYLKELYSDKAEGEGLFTFLVTMQNHSPFQGEYESKVQLDLAQEYPETEQYLTLIQESDKAFGNLIEHFEAVDEPTMVVMFGDHLPNIQDGFYNELAAQCGKEPQEYERLRFLTPYIVWTNYENEMEEIPVMDANFFGSYLLQEAGLGLTDYNKCILEILEKILVINENEIMDAQGNWYPKAEMPQEYKDLLRDYEILQYNEVFGGTQRQDGVFQINPS